MNALVEILKDLCILLYLVIKPLFLVLIPKYLRYKKWQVGKEVVLITGGANGLGRLLAIKLSALGCVVVIWDVDQDGGNQSLEIIKENGGQGYFYSCNVASREDVYLMARKVREEVGPVSILINNAGVVTGNETLLTCSDEGIDKTFGVNTLANFWTCKAFLPDMMRSNHGHIVNVVSLAGYCGVCSLSSYCSSKSAAIGFHESLSMEMKRDGYDGIKTTLVCTWHLDTNMFKGVKIRFIPPLKASYAADRIISAIRTNEEIVIIPWYFTLAVILKSIVPLSAVVKVIEMSGGFHCLDNLTANGPTTTTP